LSYGQQLHWQFTDVTQWVDSLSPALPSPNVTQRHKSLYLPNFERERERDIVLVRKA